MRDLMLEDLPIYDAVERKISKLPRVKFDLSAAEALELYMLLKFASREDIGERLPDANYRWYELSEDILRHFDYHLSDIEPELEKAFNEAFVGDGDKKMVESRQAYFEDLHFLGKEYLALNQLLTRICVQILAAKTGEPVEQTMTKLKAVAESEASDELFEPVDDVIARLDEQVFGF